MAARKTVEDLFIHELSDVYSAEKQITKALPRLARAATNPRNEASSVVAGRYLDRGKSGGR
ncbi:DUF892 family protein [Pseudomonas putida]|uniref:DUF892 family protein n=1 Tax=Pseudomonas putida TaxID=303 RepID=UPI003F403142